MTDHIEPALTPDEWAKREVEDGDTFIGLDAYADGRWLSAGNGYDPFATEKPRLIAAMTALANAALPDDDPHKITRARVVLIRHAFALASPNMESTPNDQAELLRIADALESYLPPE